MKMKSLFSTCPQTSDILADLETQLKDIDAKVLLLFSSTAVDYAALNRELKARHPETQLFGCTTAGELTSGRMLTGSVVGMAFGSDCVGKVHIEMMKGIGKADFDASLDGFAAAFKQPVSALDHEKHVGIILIDGMSGAEERVMDSLGNKTDIPIIGGSAGDDRKFEKTFVFANGEVCEDAAVLAVFEVPDGFGIIKTESFCALPKVLTVTKVQEGTRDVLEFDGKPAAEAYAEAVGVPVGQLADQFMGSPVGLVLDNGDIFVRSPQQVIDGTIRFYCQLPEGAEISLLESTDIITDTSEAIAKARRELGSISGLVVFNCILRTLELEKHDETATFGAIFEHIPTAGFATYGEELIGHINQTATMLAFR